MCVCAPPLLTSHRLYTAYLVSEPIVIALSLWMGFAWALIYLFGSSILLVFTSYDFSYSIASLFQV